jgi:hypothetical protein
LTTDPPPGDLVSVRQLRYLSDGLGQLRRRVGQGPPGAMAEAIVDVAVQTLGFADWASITQSLDGRLRTTAYTDERAREGDQLQYELGCGPCVEAVTGHPETLVLDMSTDSRWPDFTARAAADLGVCGMVSLALRLDEARVIAGLNLYCVRAGALHEGALPAAHLLAGGATLAMYTEAVPG